MFDFSVDRVILACYNDNTELNTTKTNGDYMSRLPGYYSPDDDDVIVIDGREYSEVSGDVDDLCHDWEVFMAQHRKDAIAETIALGMDVKWANIALFDFSDKETPHGWHWWKQEHGVGVGVLAPITEKELEEAANA